MFHQLSFFFADFEIIRFLGFYDFFLCFRSFSQDIRLDRRNRVAIDQNFEPVEAITQVSMRAEDRVINAV